MTWPLRGRRVMVTRTSSQAQDLCDLLERELAVPVVVPVMRLQALVDAGAIGALRQRISAGDFDDLVFTSANSVGQLLGDGRLSQAGSRAYAIGPGTAAALRKLGWQAEPLPQGYIAESLAERIAVRGASARRILLPRARGARDVLPRRLEEMGAQVEVVELYEMVPNWEVQSSLCDQLQSQELDCITFTSGSTARCFAELAGPVRPPDRCVLACIGPITAEEMRRQGMVPQVVAGTHSIPGLVQALRSWFARLPENGGCT
ncbi:MAG: uroporphyrinogen-III synthase [Candidatus Dormibacteria bacterium]